MALEVGHRLLNLMRFVELHPRALINFKHDLSVLLWLWNVVTIRTYLDLQST